MGKKQYSHIHTCGLCGKRYAVLNGSVRSGAYHQHYCKGCTNIILEMIRKLKLTMRMEQWEK